jgi:hypothetical protein
MGVLVYQCTGEHVGVCGWGDFTEGGEMIAIIRYWVGLVLGV